MNNFLRRKWFYWIGLKNMGHKNVLLLVLAAVILASEGQAATVVSNLEVPTQNPFFIYNGFWLGSPFQVPSDEPNYRLDGVTVALGNSLEPLSNFSAAIYSDSGGPAEELEELSGDLPISPGNHEFTSSGLTLEAGSSYWLAVRSTDVDGRWQIFLTPDLVSSSDGNWVLYNEFSGSNNQGSKWVDVTNSSLVYSIQATPVPEPHEYAVLMGLGLVGFGVMRRRLRGAKGLALAEC